MWISRKACYGYVLDPRFKTHLQYVVVVVVIHCSASWEFLFVWIILIYVTSCFMLISMANCLKRLPIYQEGLLRVVLHIFSYPQSRARILEKMMFYVFTYIIYGIVVAVLYGLIELMNNHFDSWNPRFLSSFVLELLFYSLITLRSIVTSFVFINNIDDMFVVLHHSPHPQNKRNFFSSNDPVWYREVQPLLNSMIRQQVLDLFSRGVNKAIHSSGVMENNKNMFNNENGIYRGVLTEDRYYKEVNSIELESSIGTDKEKMGDGMNDD